MSACSGTVQYVKYSNDVQYKSIKGPHSMRAKNEAEKMTAKRRIKLRLNDSNSRLSIAS